jgi:CheY-like chemotaxis protein
VISAASPPEGEAAKLVYPPNFPAPRCSGFRGVLWSTQSNLCPGSEARGAKYEESMTDAVATDGPPPHEGARVSDRFQRMRVAALPTVLFADANEDYLAMARDALLEGRNVTDLRVVANGEELIAYLRRAGATEGAVTPAPSLIVIDASLPGTPGGLQLVKAIKQDPETRRIPLVALGGDDDPLTVAAAYDAGANTYIVKPVTFLALVRLMKVFTAYWLETAELPPNQNQDAA